MTRVSNFSLQGTRVPGTNYQLDPVRGAFNIGAAIRWLDFNDCFLAAECISPSLLSFQSFLNMHELQGVTHPTTSVPSLLLRIIWLVKGSRYPSATSLKR